ncbi:MAG: glycosyltransferase family 2 protein [Actinobacteria bacterium]|nr:glycosyltransferase family 2 protein [Actinomycetota bacterium]
MRKINILISTFNRPTALAVTLTSLCFQSYSNFNLIISDQSEYENPFKNPSVETILRVLKSYGHNIETYKHLPRKGIAEQRNFLFSKSSSDFVLFIDDDVIMEPYVISGMVSVMEKEKCGFTGRAVIGLSYIGDFRPNEQKIEFWEGPVFPEKVRPENESWKRYKLHNAANIYHVEKILGLINIIKKIYKVAWVGGCVMYDSEKLKSVGAFNFWKNLPYNNCGEDVLAQLRVMEKYGGCGIIPSGVYHQELPTTIEDRTINAVNFLRKR